jgi:hypothetical protein
MASQALLQFYNPIPRYGQKFASQVPDMRDNSNSLSTLVRAAYADTDGDTSSEKLNLSGWALGEKGFRNKFREIWDKDATEYKMQFNKGTEGSPNWVTCVRIRIDDCRFIIQGTGGLELHGGFYGGSNLNTTINVRDSEDPSTRNTATLIFNSNAFYTSGSGMSGETLVDLRTENISGVDHGSLTGLGDDDHLQYFLTDGTKAMGGDLNAGAFRMVNVGAPVFDNDAARLAEVKAAGPGFYGIVVKESDGGFVVKTDEIVLDTSSGFYVTSAGNGKPLVSLSDKFSSYRHFASAAEWQMSHNLGTNFVTWNVYTDNFDAMFPSRAHFNDKNMAFFYFHENNAGWAVVRQAGF